MQPFMEMNLSVRPHAIALMAKDVQYMIVPGYAIITGTNQ
jgi:hypothetical protein